MKKPILLLAIFSIISQFVYAQVVSTELNITLNVEPTYVRTDLDLDNNGTVDFVIDYVSQTGGAGIYQAGIGSEINNEIVAPSFWNVIPHNIGDEIGPLTTGWYNTTGTQDPAGNFTQYSRMAYKFYGGGNTSGMWVNVANKYVGLKFLINGVTHYGYVEVSCNVDPQPGSINIVRMAYQSTPNTSIFAGDVSPSIPLCDGFDLVIPTITQFVNHAKFTIISDAVISSSKAIEFNAGTSVELLTPFEVLIGTVFSAEIEDCQ